MKSFFKKIVALMLQWEAKQVLKKYKPTIVGITGSVGKTSTKDAIYSVLSGTYHVRRSEKSFNSEIGVPLTVLGCPNAWNNPFLWIGNLLHGLSLILWKHSYPRWLVLEIGADRPGDIKRTASWVRPDIVVVTSFGKVPVHVEFFSSPEEVIKEKGYLVSALKENGLLIVNSDEESSSYFKSLTRNKAMTFGMVPGADVVGSNISVLYDQEGAPAGMTLKANYHGNSLPVNISGALGKQHAYPVLAAFAVAASQGINAVKIIEALREHVVPRGRMNIIPGLKGVTLIDDTYNASPVAMEEALSVLREIALKGKKIAVLGDMMELGKYSVEEHKKIGFLAAESANVLITVGIRARRIAEGALNQGMSENVIFQFEDSNEAGMFLESKLEKGDVVLLKGSQSIRMEKAVEKVMAEPEKAEELLVRQEEEWKLR